MKTVLTWIIALIASLGLSPITARVIETNRTTDTVTVQMANGFQYAFSGCSDYCVGDYVSAIVWKNGTEDVRDDVIVSVHYSGYADYAGDPLE